nr:RES domain-containing protein [Ornithinimicrobium sp. F0845]
MRQDETDGGCWWFSCSGEGRFDLEAPQGTCYLAESEGVAARERCGRLMAMNLPIAENIYTGRVVSEVKPPTAIGVVGDLASPDALTVGVTAELTATSDYALCQAWAQQCWDAGFGAIKYAPRFTPGGQEAALAVFGDAGDHPAYGIIVRRRALLDVLQEMGTELVRSHELGAASLDVQDDADPPAH